MPVEIISALIQIPVVAALIYLVLALEDKRQLARKDREETFMKITEALLGLIDEMASRATPDQLTAKQLKRIKDYLSRPNGERFNK